MIQDATFARIAPKPPLRVALTLSALTLSAFTLSACNSERAEIEEAVKSGIGLHRACFKPDSSRSAKLPVVVPSRIGTDWTPTSKILAGLRNAGMIRTSDAGWGQPNRAKVTLTAQGRDAQVYSELSGFCLGYARFVDLVSYELDNAKGQGSAVASYEIANTKPWFEPNHYQFVPGVAAPQEVRLRLKRHDGKWIAVLDKLPD